MGQVDALKFNFENVKNQPTTVFSNF